MSKLFSAFVGLAMLGSVGAASAAEPSFVDDQKPNQQVGAASAAEPMILSEAQMNSVTAGASAGVGIGQFGLVNLSLASIIAGIGVQNN
jgi:hypothetical protein